MLEHFESRNVASVTSEHHESASAMQLIEIFGMIGEILSWLGLGVGIPSLLITLMMRASGGPRVATTATIFEAGEQKFTLAWVVNGVTYTQPLHKLPAQQDGYSRVSGYYSTHHPHRFDAQLRPHAERLFRTLSICMLSTAGVGFLLSILPMFF